MNKLMKNKKKKGFTLVELIAVIAIIGILAAIIVPMVGKYTEKAKISKATEEMRQALMAANTGAADSGKELTEALMDTTIASAGADTTNDPFKTANGIVNLAGLKKISTLKLSECKEVIDGKKVIKTIQQDGSVKTSDLESAPAPAPES